MKNVILTKISDDEFHVDIKNIMKIKHPININVVVDIICENKNDDSDEMFEQQRIKDREYNEKYR